MRIGINTLFLVPGDVGGTEVYLRQNLVEMVAVSPENTFVLFTTRDNEGVFRSDLKNISNIEYIQLPFKAGNRPVRIVAEQLLLPRYVRKNVSMSSGLLDIQRRYVVPALKLLLFMTCSTKRIRMI